MAQNRLIQEMVVQGLNLAFTLTACYIGLKWGLVGVSWGFLISQVFAAVCYYFVVYRIIPTRLSDLIRAIAPGIQLNAILFLVLAFTDHFTGDLRQTSPALYLVSMIAAGGSFYAAAFFLLPIPALESEVSRWRGKINKVLRMV